MDIIKLLKYGLAIIAFLLFVGFTVGSYYTKIEYMSEGIAKNSQNIGTLKRSVNIVVATIQKDYPSLNIQSYFKASAKQKISIRTTVEGLKTLKKSTPQTGKVYLIKHLGFTKEQALSVFTQSKDQND